MQKEKKEKKEKTYAEIPAHLNKKTRGKCESDFTPPTTFCRVADLRYADAFHVPE